MKGDIVFMLPLITISAGWNPSECAKKKYFPTENVNGTRVRGVVKRQYLL